MLELLTSSSEEPHKMYDPEDEHPNLHRLENFKSRTDKTQQLVHAYQRYIRQ